MKPDPALRENFSFRVFIKDEFIHEGLASNKEQKKLIEKSGVDEI
jgi:hypothetical protein